MLADRDRLLRVLSDLVGNALKFSDDGGKVVVRATNTDGAVRFRSPTRAMASPQTIYRMS